MDKSQISSSGRNPFKLKENALKTYSSFRNNPNLKAKSVVKPKDKHFNLSQNVGRRKTESKFRKAQLRKNRSLGIDTGESGLMPAIESFQTPNLNKIKHPFNRTRTGRYQPKSINAARYYITDLRNYYFNDTYTDNAKLFREHFEDTFKAVKTQNRFEPISKSELEKKRVDLGEKINFSKRKILVLDMDETLIHAEYTLDVGKPDVFQMTNDAGITNYVSSILNECLLTNFRSKFIFDQV
jgi:hypothetical protein